MDLKDSDSWLIVINPLYTSDSKMHTLTNSEDGDHSEHPHPPPPHPPKNKNS